MKRYVLFLLFFVACTSSARADSGLVPHWKVNPPDSTVTFRVNQMGSAFRGAVTKFNPDIFFDPEHPEKSHATVEIDVSGITTGDKERDASLFIKDWFDLAEFPTARFASDSFKRTGKNTYEAPGTLTIKSVSVPVVLPFTIEMTAPGQGLKKAHVKGSVVLDRSKFHLGQGEWADPGVIANNVTVDIDLTAYTK